MAEHTPLPWHIMPGTRMIMATMNYGGDHAGETYELRVIEGPEDDFGSESAAERWDADIEFIVRACNTQQELIDAAEYYMQHPFDSEGRNHQAITRLRVAIGRAKGERE